MEGEECKYYLLTQLPLPTNPLNNMKMFVPQVGFEPIFTAFYHTMLS